MANKRDGERGKRRQRDHSKGDQRSDNMLLLYSEVCVCVCVNCISSSQTSTEGKHEVKSDHQTRK